MKSTSRTALGLLAVGISALLFYGPLNAQPGNRDRRPGPERFEDDRPGHGRRDDFGPPPRDDWRGPGGPDFGGRGRDNRGPRRPPPPVEFSVERLNDAVTLTGGQREKVQTILDSMHAQMQRTHEQTIQQVETALTPAQREKLQQIRQRNAPPLPPLEEIAPALDLNSQQRNRVNELEKQKDNRMKSIVQNEKLSVEERRTQIRQLRDDIRRQIETTLTPAQREKARQLFAPPPPRFDGPPRDMH
jgi:hypothetical protein